MNSRSSSLFFQFILVLVLLGSLTWILQAEAGSSLHGEEFYLQWASGRLLAFEDQNPYTSTITLDESMRNSESWQSIPRHLNTPLYSLFVIFPFVLIEDFDIALLAWWLLSELCVLSILVSLLKLTDWRIKPHMVIMVVSFLGFNYSSFEALISGSLILLAGAFLALSFLALKSGKVELAGILLALTTIQPHFFILLYPLVILWVVSIRKWGLVIWFLAGILILSIISALVIPGWAIDYFRILWEFTSNFPLWSPGDVLVNWLPGIGNQLGWVLTFLMAVLMIFEWIFVRGKELQWFFWTACLTLVASQLIGIPSNPASQSVLVLPLLLILSVWVQRAGIPGQRILILSIIGAFIVPWYLANQAGLAHNLSIPKVGLFLFFPIVVLAGIFWVRWWAIRPMRLYVEELRGDELG